MNKDFSGQEVPLVPGTLRVYRQWQAVNVLESEDDWGGVCHCGDCPPIPPGTHLIPMNFMTPWVDGENVAICQEAHRVAPHIGPASEVPGRECQCGFYGTREPVSSWTLSHSYVSGVVEVYGRVIIGTRGVRAQKARIVAACINPTYVSGSHLPDQLMERYSSVDWMSSAAEVFDKYPPQNIDEILGMDTLAGVIEAQRQGIEQQGRINKLHQALLDASSMHPNVSFEKLAEALKDLNEEGAKNG